MSIHEALRTWAAAIGDAVDEVQLNKPLPAEILTDEADLALLRLTATLPGPVNVVRESLDDVSDLARQWCETYQSVMFCQGCEGDSVVANGAVLSCLECGSQSLLSDAWQSALDGSRAALVAAMTKLRRRVSDVAGMVDVQSKPEGKRRKQRSTKEQTTLKVHAAITLKMKNPELPESECAQQVGLAPSTLHQNPEWQDWSAKAVASAGRGSIESLQKKWDGHLGKFLSEMPGDDS